MAKNRRADTQKRAGMYYESEYVVGNTVKKLDEPYRRESSRRLAAVPERSPYREPQRRKRPAAAPIQQTSWDLLSLLFMAAAISVTMYICVSYLQVQHTVVTLNKTIASMESEILELKNQNDAAYNKVDTSVDLAYIYKVATEELGMVHPIENQVYSYRNQKSDYVRQYGEIPEAEN